MTGYRTYISLLCIFLIQILNQMGLKDVTGETLNSALQTLFLVGAFIFHAFHKTKEVTK